GLWVTGGNGAFPRLLGCMFDHNHATAGGAIAIDHSTNGDCRLLAQNCHIGVSQGNASITPVGASGTGGGGVLNLSYADNPPPTFRDCSINENKAFGASGAEGGDGGGIFSQGNLRLLNCTFYKNSAQGEDATTSHAAYGGNGGAIFSGPDGQTLVYNCTFSA